MIKKISDINGFTLIELLVTITISALVLAIAGPGFKELISSNRTVTTANILVAALGFARSEAVKSGISVLTHRKGSTGQNWDTGWDIFFDINGDGDYDVGTDTLLKTYDSVPPGFTLRTGATFTNSITYDATGLVASAAGDTFKLCNSDGDIATAREIIVNNVGRVYTQTGTASCP